MISSRKKERASTRTFAGEDKNTLGDVGKTTSHGDVKIPFQTRRSEIPFQTEGSYWFRRLVRDLYRMSKYFRVIRIRDGFFRIYWKDAYVHEMYKEMPYRGYTWYTDSPYKESLKLMQEYEQDGTVQRKVKNFVEGYAEASKAIKLRVYQFKHNDEHYQVAKKAYRQMVVK